MITRTIVETRLRNDETGEEKTLYGNFSIYKEKKAGFHVVSTEMATYEMSLEVFIQYATKREEK